MALLLVHAAASSALMSFETTPFFYSDNFLAKVEALSRAPTSSPAWRCDSERCTLVYPISHLQAASIKLTMDDTGKSIILSGERKIEGCTCQPRQDATINLPFTPARAEEIDTKLDAAERLTITLEKHAKMKEPISLEIRYAEKSGDTKANALRFVPHASAQSDNDDELSAEEKVIVKSALDKFRAVSTYAKKPDTSKPGHADGTDVNETNTGTSLPSSLY